MDTTNKQYIGDAVYVEDRGHDVRLTTTNGRHETNEIYLDDDVMKALIEYWGKARNAGGGDGEG